MTLRIPLEVGKTYNRLTVIEEFSKIMEFDGRTRPVYVSRVRCSCGNEKEIVSRHVRTGAIKSCGCLRIDNVCKDPKIRAAQYVVTHSRHRGIHSKYGFHLTIDEVSSLIFQPCHYCGTLPAKRNKLHSTERRFGLPMAPSHGLDRVDSSKGYTLGNVVTCCWDCNTAKLDMTVPEFVAFIRRIANHMHLISDATGDP